MATYLELKTRIADELRRTDLASQISLSVQDAIRFYEGAEAFWFNESRAATFNTVASQEFYSSSDLTALANLPNIWEVTITINSQRYKLLPRTYQYLEEISINTSLVGQPSDWAYFAQQLRLYPIPDAVYAIRVSATPRLTALSADADTNGWTQDGEPLIRAHAKWDLYMNVIGEPQRAGEQASIAQTEVTKLRRETTRRTTSGFIMPTYF